MSNDKRTADSKRTKLPRDMTKAPKFIKDCERLSRSGKHDMHRLKEAMLLIIANDGPLPPEWNDHELKGEFDTLRECHVKGDLLLTYKIESYDGDSLVTFLRAGTHSNCSADKRRHSFMQNYSGPIWKVEEPGTGHYYAFNSEEFALWFRERRTVHRMLKGSQPTDNGHLFLTPAQRNEVLLREPELAKFIRRVLGSKEFIQNIERYCFWLVDASPSDIKHSKILYERVSKVKEFRLSSKAEQTRKDSDILHLFQQIRQPKTPYLLIPASHPKRDSMSL